jgi:hypothetical protein
MIAENLERILNLTVPEVTYIKEWYVFIKAEDIKTVEIKNKLGRVLREQLVYKKVEDIAWVDYYDYHYKHGVKERIENKLKKVREEIAEEPEKKRGIIQKSFWTRCNVSGMTNDFYTPCKDHVFPEVWDKLHPNWGKGIMRTIHEYFKDFDYERWWLGERKSYSRLLLVVESPKPRSIEYGVFEYNDEKPMISETISWMYIYSLNPRVPHTSKLGQFKLLRKHYDENLRLRYPRKSPIGVMLERLVQL